MSDNATLPLTGAGDVTAVVAADDIGGVKHQRVKLTLGADGVSDGDVSSANPIPITAASLPLPATASTAAKQDTGNTSLASIDTKTPALGQALAAGSVPVVLTVAQLATITPPAAITGFATSAKQDTAQTSLSAIDSKLGGTLTVGAHSVNNGAGASAVNIQDGGNSITVDGTVAVSGAVAVTDNAGSLTVDAPVGTPVFARLSDGSAALVGQKTMASSLPVVIASDQSALTLTLSTRNRKTAYAASSAVSITLASLASDTNLLAGVESDLIDNSSNLYLDYLLAGKITQGTTPTTAKEIRVYVVGMMDDSTWPDVFDGTGSAETVTTANIRDSICRLAAVMATDSTSDRVNYFGPVSVASLFGGVVPRKFVVFVVHNTAVNLNATGGNHVLSITPVYETN